MKAAILIQNSRFVATLNGARIGASNRREGARNLVAIATRALDHDARAAKLESRIRRARQNVFTHDGAGVNIERMKMEMIRLRSKVTGWNVPALRRAVKA